MLRRVAFLVSLSLLLLPASATAQTEKKKNADPSQIGERKSRKGPLNFYSPERELELGERLAQEMEHSVRLLRDPVVVDYVAEVAERIARNSDTQMPVRVRIVDSDEVGAFALPGGFLYVYTGLLLEAQTEAELASVLAHEVAHISARHATRQMTKVQMWNLASIPLVLLGGPTVYAIRNGAALAVPLTFLKFSRNAESEADRLGLQYHAASGYDPVAFITFFERIKRMEGGRGGGIARVFSTHPMTRDRIVAAERMMDEQLPPREEYVVTTSRHYEVQSYLRSLVGERKNEGVVLRKRTTEKSSKDPF